MKECKLPRRTPRMIEDVGMATAFLASGYAKLITGVYVDGGYHIPG